MSNNMELSSLLRRELSVPASIQRSLSVLSSRDDSSTAESPAISPLPSQSEGTVLNDGNPLEWLARKERKSWVWLPVNGKDIWHEKRNGWKWHCAWCRQILIFVQEIYLLILDRS